MRIVRIGIAIVVTLILGVSALRINRAWLYEWRLRRSAAALGERPLRGRLSGFAHTPPAPNPSKAALGATTIAWRIVNDFSGSQRAEEIHAAGVALLVADRSRRAIALLERTVSLQPEKANCWNDLAVGHLALYEAERDAPQLVSALAAIDHALRIDETLPEALFNRALILETMGLDAPAFAAYHRSLANDRDSGWSKEADERRHRLAITTRTTEWHRALIKLRIAAADPAAVQRIVAAFPQDARANGETLILDEWASAVLRGDGAAARSALQLAGAIGRALATLHGETLLRDAVVSLQSIDGDETRRNLARAQQQYVNARRMYESRNVSSAHPLFVEAGRIFREARNPMANVADFYVAACLYDSNRGDEALTALKRLGYDLAPTHIALRAFVQWEIGAVWSRKGMLAESLEAQRRSLALFEHLGEDGNANVIGSMAAGTESVLGRRLDAWRTRLDLFRRISRSGDAGDLQRALDLAARTEALDDRWENAFSLMGLAIEPGLQSNPRVYVSSLTWHALAAHRLGVPGIIPQDTSAARRAAAGIRDETIRKRAESDVTFLEAVTSQGTQPARTIALLDRYIDEARRGGNLFLLSEALLVRGQAQADLGNEAQAIQDFDESLRLTTNASQAMPLAQLRDAYFRTADTAAYGLVKALMRRGRIAKAFMTIDTLRMRPYAAADAKKSTIRPGTVIVEYVVLPDSVLIFTMTERRLVAHRSAATKEQVAQASMDFVRQLDAKSAAATRLSQWVIGPIEDELRASDRVVIIPDPVIAAVPFAMLPLPRAGSLLLEHLEITIAPNSAIALQSSDRHAPPQSVLVVANPSFDRLRFRDLSPLPAAEKEAGRIAALYPRSTVLTGSAATRARVLTELVNRDVVHIASHALLLQNEPARSHVLLAPSGEDLGVLYLADIERETMRRTRLVILAGCDTATPSAVRRNVDTLALAFIAAGAANVVGTLWDVEDEATEAFSVLLHHELRRGATPQQAVQHAQSAMRSSPNARLRQPRAWAAFQVYGQEN